jgi:uncharacterized protein YhjY with autotransporter beta-barrel domain
MQRSTIGCAGVLVAVVSIGWSIGTSAATTPLGMAIQDTEGSSTFLVNAGDAIQQTCAPLAAANSQSPLTGARQDLFYRCNEMIGTYVPGTPGAPSFNSYGYAQGTSGDANRLNAVRQFSGEEASSEGRFATDSSNRQFANLGDRLSAIRRGVRSSMSGVALNLDGEQFDSNTFAPIVGGGASADESNADLAWAWFANVGVGFGDRDQTENEDGYDYDSYVVTVGADYAFASGLVLGMAAGYNDYRVDFDNHPASVADPATPTTGGDVDGDGYTISGYGTYSTDRFFVNGIVTYGANDYDMTRRIQLLPGPVPVGRPAPAQNPGFEINRRLRSNTDSDQWAGQATVGTSFGTGAISADLYVGIDYLTVNIDGFTESEQDFANTNPTPTPGLALRFSDQELDSTQSVLGFSVRQAWNTGVGVILPYIGAEWRHEFEDDTDPLDYRYEYGISQPNFDTPTDDFDTDFFVASGGISAQFANNLFAYLEYDATLGLSRTTANFVTLGIRGSF